MRQTTTWQIPYPESPDHTRTWEYWQAIAERADACLTTVQNAINNKAPYALWAGTGSVVITNAVSGTCAFTYPVGRFTQPPIVTAMGIATGNHYTYIAQGTNTINGVTCGLAHRDGAVATATYTAHAHAIQMTSAAAPGRSAEEPAEGLSSRQATCHTAGCDNADAQIPILTPDPDTPITCGVCGQPITDAPAAAI